MILLTPLSLIIKHKQQWTQITREYPVFVYVYQVVTLRMVHEKLLRLLPGMKQQALTSDRVFEPFSGLNPLHYNPYTEVSCGKLFVCKCMCRLQVEYLL